MSLVPGWEFRSFLVLVLTVLLGWALAPKKGSRANLWRWQTGLQLAGLSAQQHYDSLGKGDLIGSGGFINMGDWTGVSLLCFSRDAPRLAGQQLTSRLAHRAGLISKPAERVFPEALRSREKVVVDAGCGYGEACFFLQQTAPEVQTVIGVNISAVQLERCAETLRLLNARQLDGETGAQVQFVHASCTQLPMKANTVDVVWSLEASHHFNTRHAFFQEAFRVLKPGGCLAWADVVLPPPRSAWQRFMFRWISTMMGVPSANLGTLQDIRHELFDAGFVSSPSHSEDLTVASVHGFRRYILLRGWMHLIRHPSSLILPGLCWLAFPMSYHLLIVPK